MKATIKQGRQTTAIRPAAKPLSHVLKNFSAKNFLVKSRRPRETDFKEAALLNITAHAATARKVSRVKNASPDESVESVLAGTLPFEHSLVMSYISSCRQENRMIYVSPHRDNLGFSRETWLGKADLRMQQVHRDDHDRVRQALQHSCRTGEVFKCDYRLYDSNGKVRWFHDEARVLCDGSGSPLFIRGVMLDVTEKKELEAELLGHRYYLERNVEMRTEQLVRRMALLESCNVALGAKLALAQKELAALKLQKAVPDIKPEQGIKPEQDTKPEQTVPKTPVAQAMPLAQTEESNTRQDGIGDWARNMIGLRGKPAGVVG